jgi:hypothetical protein
VLEKLDRLLQSVEQSYALLCAQAAALCLLIMVSILGRCNG